MGRDGTSGGYDFMEILIIKFVLADVIIIAALLLADPIYAVTITALLVASVFVTWYLTERVGRTKAAESDDGSERDPVTKLQERYAAGDLSETEFEAALDRLIDANGPSARASRPTSCRSSAPNERSMPGAPSKPSRNPDINHGCPCVVEPRAVEVVSFLVRTRSISPWTRSASSITVR